MFNAKIIFWISVALLITLIDPDTLVKILAVLWVLYVGFVGFVKFCFWYAKRKGAVKVTFVGDENEPRGLSAEWPNCTCRPSQKMGRTKTGWKCPACGETLNES